MNTEIKNAVAATDKEAQYDDRAKRLLGQKSILAYILVGALEEYKGMKPTDVIPYIEGTPYISAIPVEPGLTNALKDKSGRRVVGLNTESSEVNEGLARFDIIFYVRMKDGLSQIIINVEAQKDEPEKYKILNRAIYYVSRLISSQKEREFVRSDYDSIKRVYSIWVCMNMEENSMNCFRLTEKKVIGSKTWDGSLDLFNIVLIGLSRELPEHNEKYELHRLLAALLSSSLTKEEKFNVLEKEYQIPVDDEIREDVRIMCNLGKGVKEEGIRIGEKIGEKIGRTDFILRMYNKGYPLEEIADVADKSVEEIKEIIEKKEPVSV